MSGRIKNRMSSSVNYQPLELYSSEYNNADINWEDSAMSTKSSPVADPSMNDFIKGYNMDSGRYEFRQYANDYSKNVKQGAKEVQDISFTPKNIAKEILTKSRNNGTVQDFFNQYCSNGSINNEMKEKIAKILTAWGYPVIPTLLDETPRYATRRKNTLSKFSSLVQQYSNKDDVGDFVDVLEYVFPDSKIIQKVAKEARHLNNVYKIKIDIDTTRGLMDYYNKIFPSDFTKQLVDKLLNKRKVKYFDEFRDFELSDATLSRMEQFNSGNQLFMSKSPKDGGGMGGYNFPADMRGDGPGGVRPNMFEVGPRLASRMLKKKR